jgi:hypothetical protein
VGLRASLDFVVKREIPSLTQDLNLLIIQPIVQHYTTELSWLLFMIYTNLILLKCVNEKG